MDKTNNRRRNLTIQEWEAMKIKDRTREDIKDTKDMIEFELKKIKELTMHLIH